ncbi:Zn-dependent protease [Streptacidiphilus sp. BW17]|uniref:site-2 protease family protein n=1 Tax=Streptacidiphilus sp. BW17 TaxID=3156274 RepID=UPI00351728D0
MNGSVPLGRLFGIPLRVHWSAPLLVVLLTFGLAGNVLPAWVPGRSSGVYLLGGLVGALLLIASLVLHEVAHGVVARRAGTRVDDMTVWGLGGVTRIGRLHGPGRELLVALAGPVVSLLLAAATWGAGLLALNVLDWDVPAAVLIWTGVVNLLVAVFNLLPGAPLDGGRVLQAALWWRGGDRDRAERQAGRCGQVLGAALVLGGWIVLLRTATGSAGVWLLLVGAFLMVAASAEVRHAALAASARGVRVGEAMTTPAFTRPDWSTVDRVFEESTTWRSLGAVPVVDLNGYPSGVVRWRTLLGIPPGRRGDVRLRDVAVPVSTWATAATQDDLLDALDDSRGRLPLLVLDGGLLVGTVTTLDLARLVRGGRFVPGTQT